MSREKVGVVVAASGVGLSEKSLVDDVKSGADVKEAKERPSVDSLLMDSQREFAEAVRAARKEHIDDDLRLAMAVTKAVFPGLSRLSDAVVGNWDDAAVRKTAERAYWDALDARAHIAALSAEYWLGTVFLESVGLNVPEEYITLWATYRYTTLDVLRLSLTCMMIFFKSDHPPQFLLQIQPDLAERPPSPSPDANSAADSLSSS